MFGVRGEVRLFVHNVAGGVLDTERSVVLVSPEGEERPARLVARRGAGKRVLGRIAGVGAPEQAAALMGWGVEIDRAALPAPAPGEHYIHDLLDLPVFDERGAALGRLADVVTGEKDVWVVDTPTGEQFVLATPDNVLAVEPDRIVLAVGALGPGD